MNHELYELTEYDNPVSGIRESHVRYNGTGTTQNIVFLRDHWNDIVIGAMILRLQTYPQFVKEHPDFQELKALIDRLQ